MDVVIIRFHQVSLRIKRKKRGFFSAILVEIALMGCEICIGASLYYDTDRQTVNRISTRLVILLNYIYIYIYNSISICISFK